MILWKAFGGKMTQAFWLMSQKNITSGKGNSGLTSRQYESLRIDYSKLMSENNPFQNLTLEQKQLAIKNSADTTRRLGLLKGKNHPLYGKGHSKKSKLKIKQNHAICSGENNSHAKKWILENSTGIVYYINGTLKKTCIEHNISYSVLIRNRGIKITAVFGKTAACLNTIGWSLIENE